METIIHECEAKWGRRAYIKLVDDKVIYDDSQDEYGPIEFDIKLLIKALAKHMAIKDKPFIVANVREITDKWDNEDITYSCMVEKLNEIAIIWHNKQQ